MTFSVRGLQDQEQSPVMFLSALEAAVASCVPAFAAICAGL